VGPRSDILQLQQWLNTNGYPLAQTGVGSPGQETDIFGPHTYRAPLKFQAAHDLPQTGYFGPLTRAAIAATDGSSSSANQASGTSSETNGSVSSASSTSSPYIPGVTPLPGYTPGQIIFGGGGSNNNTRGGCGGSSDTPPIISAISSGSPTTTSATIT
jgi:peptidoglycan hydrolase-like protein with peptidoglycan-binding domain